MERFIIIHNCIVCYFVYSQKSGSCPVCVSSKHHNRPDTPHLPLALVSANQRAPCHTSQLNGSH